MFGSETKSMSDKNNDVHKFGREIFAMNFENVMRFKIRLYASTLYNWLGYIISEKRFTTSFSSLLILWSTGESITYADLTSSIYLYVGISAVSPILDIPDEIPIYKNFMKWWLFIWNWVNKIGLLILNNE